MDQGGVLDPKGPSYWEYPTGPRRGPNASRLDVDGNVVNASDQALSTYRPKQSGTFPTWCPSQAGADCSSVNPLHLAAWSGFRVGIIGTVRPS